MNRQEREFGSTTARPRERAFCTLKARAREILSLAAVVVAARPALLSQFESASVGAQSPTVRGGNNRACTTSSTSYCRGPCSPVEATASTS